MNSIMRERGIVLDTPNDNLENIFKKCVQFGHILKTCKLITFTKNSN